MKNWNRHTLKKLLPKLNQTKRWQESGYPKSLSLHDFCTLPLSHYNNYVEFIDRIKQGEKNVLWPGNCHLFAVSSGTTGVGKHFPIYRERLKSDLRFLRKVAIEALKTSRFKIITGSHLSLPGSIERIDNHILGEISGILAYTTPEWVNYFQSVKPKDVIFKSWEEKYEEIIKKSVRENITLISAVPSWIPLLFDSVLIRSGKSSIEALWPNLGLIITGGVKLDHYKPTIESYFKQNRPKFIECYGASEAYLGFDRYQSGHLNLVLNNGIYYEFIETDTPEITQNGITLEDVKPEISYKPVLTTNSGLVRYILQDEIYFHDISKLEFSIIGRANDICDISGEAVEINEIKAILNTHSITYATFHLATTIYDGIATIHLILTDSNLNSMPDIGMKLDKSLRQLNRHYDIRRRTGVLTQIAIYTISLKALTELWIRISNNPRSQLKVPPVIKKNSQLFIDRLHCVMKDSKQGSGR